MTDSPIPYLDQLPSTIDRDGISDEHRRLQQWVNQDKKGFLRYRNPYLHLSTLQTNTVNCDNDVVTIGGSGELDETEQRKLEESLRAFMPWRKGPFSVFGIDIDAEWRSERKWQRLQNYLPELSGKVIADIGCSNGYYMFRMAPYRPKLVVGFEPSVQHYYCFRSLNNIAGLPFLHIDLLGVEHLALFPECFDVIFLMGIIYHRSSPVEVLRDILCSLKPGGSLILESQGLPGEEPLALFPEKTYAKVPGTYFVPTGPCLVNWMKRAGFKKVELFCSHPMSEAEQRRTSWMVFESYQDFIDKNDPSRTVEGYPAPLRVYLRGEKG
ncbi:MAG: tRNA 5-methoxyuridine(34)/uridine 5-oxyacetic acid(34) synthase CmoB [Thermodesulfobacteriota bacterium]